MKLKIGVQLHNLIVIQKLLLKPTTRMANHLNEIINPSQTAYVPGWSVMDNIRNDFYIKNLCNSEKRKK